MPTFFYPFCVQLPQSPHPPRRPFNYGVEGLWTAVDGDVTAVGRSRATVARRFGVASCLRGLCERMSTRL